MIEWLMNYETERIWKEVVLPAGTEENHEKSQSGSSVSRLRFEHGMF
jgi:hypothetical protein